MRFFMTVTPSHDYLEGKPPPQSLMDAMGPYMGKAVADGSLISTAGLKPLTEGTFLSARGGRITVKDGPFAESKEVIAGFAIMDVKDKAEGIALGKRFLELAGDGVSEMRELHAQHPGNS